MKRRPTYIVVDFNSLDEFARLLRFAFHAAVEAERGHLYEINWRFTNRGNEMVWDEDQHRWLTALAARGGWRERASA
jgi:hypothetical protein